MKFSNNTPTTSLPLCKPKLFFIKAPLRCLLSCTEQLYKKKKRHLWYYYICYSTFNVTPPVNIPANLNTILFNRGPDKNDNANVGEIFIIRQGREKNDDVVVGFCAVERDL